jgi:putative peptidoglycan lipid II flippase
MTSTPPSSAKPHSLAKSISIAALIMAASSLLSRLLGFVRISVLAHMCGTGSEVDAYVVSFFIPDLINHLLAGSALSITFVPIFQKYWLADDKEKAARFFSNVLTIGTIGFIVLIAGAMFFTEPICALLGTNINNPAQPEVFRLTVLLTRIVLPAQLFFFWGALLNGVQYANKRFLLPALAPVLYNCGIILGGTLLYPVFKIAGFSWGVVIGGLVGSVLIQLPGVYKLGIRFRPRFDLRDPDLHRYVLLTLPFVVGLSMTFSNDLLLRIFGSFSSVGAGALSSLDFAYKLMFFLVGIFGQGLAAGAYPYLSQLVIEKKFLEVNQLLGSLTTKTAAVLMPCCGILMVLSSNIVAVLLQHGRFTARSTDLTASAFCMYLPGALFASVLMIINRVFYAMQRTVLPLVVNTIVVALSLPLYWQLGNTAGVAGLAGAATISMMIFCAAMYGLYLRQYHDATLADMLKKLALIAGITVPVTLCGWGIKSWLHPYTGRIDSIIMQNLLLCLGTGLPAGALALLLLDLLGIQKVRSLLPHKQRRYP